MSFKTFLKEYEELQIADAEKSKKDEIASLIRDIDDLNDEKFREFATTKLGMSDEEAGSVVYKMLRDFLLADADGEEEAELELDIDVDGDEEDLEGLGDIADGDLDDTPLLDLDGEDEAEGDEVATDDEEEIEL